MELITACRVCHGSDLKTFFDLGAQPLANSLLDRPDEPEDAYPLSLSWCPRCNLVQLNHTVDPKKLFDEYVWVTGTSRTAQQFAQTFFDELVARAPHGKACTELFYTLSPVALRTTLIILPCASYLSNFLLR